MIHEEKQTGIERKHLDQTVNTRENIKHANWINVSHEQCLDFTMKRQRMIFITAFVHYCVADLTNIPSCTGLRIDADPKPSLNVLSVGRNNAEASLQHKKA